MSTVTLSNPHCAITSAEKPDGIASQAFTTALPEAQICLTLFGIDRVSPCHFLIDPACLWQATPWRRNRASYASPRSHHANLRLLAKLDPLARKFHACKT